MHEENNRQHGFNEGQQKHTDEHRRHINALIRDNELQPGDDEYDGVNDQILSKFIGVSCSFTSLLSREIHNILLHTLRLFRNIQ
jgi:hypothetical protein